DEDEEKEPVVKRRRKDEDDDEDEEPRRRKKKKKRQDDEEESGFPWMLVGGGGFLVIALVILLIILLNRGGERPTSGPVAAGPDDKWLIKVHVPVKVGDRRELERTLNEEVEGETRIQGKAQPVKNAAKIYFKGEIVTLGVTNEGKESKS